MRSAAPPPLVNFIWAMMIVWRMKEGKLSELFCVVLCTSVAPQLYAHTWAVLKSWVLIFRSTPLSRPNNIRRGNVRPSVCTSVCPSVRPSTKSLSDFHEIWCVHRGRRVMHDSMPYDPIQRQGQGHGACEVPKIALFKLYLLRHLQRVLANDH